MKTLVSWSRRRCLFVITAALSAYVTNWQRIERGCGVEELPAGGEESGAATEDEEDREPGEVEVDAVLGKGPTR